MARDVVAVNTLVTCRVRQRITPHGGENGRRMNSPRRAQGHNGCLRGRLPAEHGPAMAGLVVAPPP
jgi:hypothetical protein